VIATTGSWALPARALELGLADLKNWRSGASQRLMEFRRWATVARIIDEQTAARLAHLERRLATERLTIAFVAEYSRGKSELINALFFSDFGTRILPSGVGRTTLCRPRSSGTRRGRRRSACCRSAPARVRSRCAS
jgi:hypothetical protein